MKKAFITIAAVCGFAVLYITMCSPDPPTELVGYKLEKGLFMGDFNSEYDALSGEATFNGTIKGKLPWNEKLVVDITSVDGEGDTSVSSCVGEQLSSTDIYWSASTMHPLKRPHSAWIKAYPVKY